MKSIAIVGCGAQGGPCATIISRILDVESIVLADLDVAGAEAVKEKIGDKRISVKKLDASDLDSVHPGRGRRHQSGKPALQPRDHGSLPRGRLPLCGHIHRGHDGS